MSHLQQPGVWAGPTRRQRSWRTLEGVAASRGLPGRLLVEGAITARNTEQGRLPVVMKNLKPGANAVVTTVRFVAEGKGQ